MDIKLRPVIRDELETIWKMQVEAFSTLLKKYQDYETSPGAEKLYGDEHWWLDTILQEKGNLHLYEKLGYHQTGKIDNINERMDIVFYEKG